MCSLPKVKYIQCTTKVFPSWTPKCLHARNKTVITMVQCVYNTKIIAFQLFCAVTIPWLAGAKSETNSTNKKQYYCIVTVKLIFCDAWL